MFDFRVFILFLFWKKQVLYVHLVKSLNLFLKRQFPFLNPFLANVFILYHLKTPENQRLFGIFRVCKTGFFAKNGLKKTLIYCRIDEAKQYSNDNVQIVLIGNKCDRETRKVVTYEQGQELADQLGCPFFEASVKDNVNVDDAFEKLIDIICDNMRATAESEPLGNGDANAGTVVLRNAEEEDVAGRRKWCPWCK